MSVHHHGSASLVDLLVVLVRKELKLRYQGTALGIAWSIANPLALALVLHFAVKRVFAVEIEDYALFLLAALFPWQWMSNAIGAAPVIYTSHASLIQKLSFPRPALCIAAVLGDMIHFAISLGLFALLRLLWTGSGPGLEWLLAAPLLIGVQAVIVASIVLVIATANTLLRDLEHLVQVGLLLLFYLTPILYPTSMIPDGFAWMTLLNPLAPLIIAWRALLIEDVISAHIIFSLVHAALLVGAAYSIDRALGWRVPEAA